MTAPSRRTVLATLLVGLVAVPSLLAGAWLVGVARGLTAALYLTLGAASTRPDPDPRFARMWRLVGAASAINVAALLLLALQHPAEHPATWAPAIPQIIGVNLLLAAAVYHPLAPRRQTRWGCAVLQVGTMVSAQLTLLLVAGAPLSSVQGWALVLLAVVPGSLVVIGLNRVEAAELGRAAVLAVPLLVIATGGTAYHALRESPSRSSPAPRWWPSRRCC